MDLMGQWGPGSFASQLGLDNAVDLPCNLGCAPFPEVAGGAGLPTEGFAEPSDFGWYLMGETEARSDGESSE